MPVCTRACLDYCVRAGVSGGKSSNKLTLEDASKLSDSWSLISYTLSVIDQTFGFLPFDYKDPRSL